MATSTSYEAKAAMDKTTTPGFHDDHDKSNEPSHGNSIDFVTLGMLILDDIDLPAPLSPVRGILGGAGTYAAVGARILSPAPRLSRTVGWVVDRGHDFPAAISAELQSWHTSALFRDDPSRATTRGWNGYGATFQSANRAFKYTTPKRRITPADLTSELLASRSFHLICGSERCQTTVRKIRELRRKMFLCINKRSDALGAAEAKGAHWAVHEWQEPDKIAAEQRSEQRESACESSPDISHGNRTKRPPDPTASAKSMHTNTQLATAPLIIWEPVPDLCTRTELANVASTLPLVDVCSPNHSELAALLGDETGFVRPDNDVDRAAVGRGVERLLAKVAPPPGLLDTQPYMPDITVIVRCGAAGCYVARRARARPHRLKPNSDQKYDFRDADLTQVGGGQAESRVENLIQKSSGPPPIQDDIKDDDDDDDKQHHLPDLSKWFPAFHSDSLPSTQSTHRQLSGANRTNSVSEPQKHQFQQHQQRNAVVDPTGGGNTFLGGLAVAMARGYDIDEAVACASVAASFAVEQVGLPVLGWRGGAVQLGKDSEAAGHETWNGVVVEDRLAEYRRRTETVAQ